MKFRFIEAHMRVAYIYANLSYCVRRKVGCVIVKDDKIISIGYNGTPSGFSNTCETEDGKSTLPITIHAELNAITKLAKSHESGNGASLFVTTAPCQQCAITILQSGITNVYYCEDYRGVTDGVDFLRKAGIKVLQVSLE